MLYLLDKRLVSQSPCPVNNPFWVSHPEHLAVLMGLTIWNAYLIIWGTLDYSCITNQRYPLTLCTYLMQASTSSHES